MTRALLSARSAGTPSQWRAIVEEPFRVFVRAAAQADDTRLADLAAEGQDRFDTYLAAADAFERDSRQTGPVRGGEEMGQVLNKTVQRCRKLGAAVPEADRIRG